MQRKLEAVVALEEGADLAERMALSGERMNRVELRQEADQLRHDAERDPKVAGTTNGAGC